MDHQQADPAKCASRGNDSVVELKPSLSRMFSFDAADPPSVQKQSSGRRDMRPASSFNRHGSSRRNASLRSGSLGRSLSRSRRASSHFCDIEVDEDMVDDRQSVIHGVIDEEMAVVAVVPQPAADDVPGKKPASAVRSRLGVILLDQGLFTVYKRLFVLCIALNATGLALAATGRFPYARTHAAVFAMGNILALTLCRSEAVLRVVFWLAVTLFGRSWVPVLVKTGVTAILQSLGGVHSGCGMSSLAWLVYALVQVLQNRDVTPREIVGVASATRPARSLVHGRLPTSAPPPPQRYDPATESYDNLTGTVLVKRQELWLTASITFFTFLPWLTVRRVPVTVTARSTHASIITFHGGMKAGLLGRISRSPLSEWHAFGIISDGGDTHAMLAGAVGDFTQGLISDPPSSLWVRNVHFAGLPYLLNMYRRATMVATGSGICVFLSFLMQPGAAELSLVWVAKGIEANYGEEMKAAVSRSEQLRGRVLVHDTAVMGRPNVADLAVGAAKKWDAEVVIVTSNPEGSRDVVTGCNMAGIPAFGPIWDS
ncbi:hypothetical protein PR202_ga10525 [Eleusine coracana subsp. coracana]|uniref:Uncharacterized protein n=1 Tax=Eleusine coracana subsp. coracana TaxID=191504 RepID=A0AAV5C703_ELECO|nr:hypothetical protein PR202_ga10525 [Eleusine coracana subsp. coracana]